jgi:hypothetical protein
MYQRIGPALLSSKPVIKPPKTDRERMTDKDSRSLFQLAGDDRYLI